MNADTPNGAGYAGEYIDLAVEVFSMLAEPTRIRIVLALQHGELSVGQLADAVGKAPAAVSQHLAKLRLARIVTTRQDGQRVYYSLTNEHAIELVTNSLQQAEHALDDSPSHHRLP